MRAATTPAAEPEQCEACGGEGVIARAGRDHWLAEPCVCSLPHGCSCEGFGWIEQPQEIEGGRYRTSVRCPRCGLAADRARALQLGGFPRRYIRARLDPPPAASTLHRQLFEWVVRWKRGGPGLFVHGPTGTGKTWGVIGAMRKLVLVRHHQGQAVPVRYVDMTQLCRRVKERMREGHARAELLRPLRSTSVLVVDEVGAGRRSEYDVNDLLATLVQDRHNDGRTTIYVSNYSPSELEELLQVDGAEYSAARLVDRMAYQDPGRDVVIEVPRTATNRRRAATR